MAGWREYILSVILTALVCGIIKALVFSQSRKEWIRLLCGLVLTLTVVKPLLGFRNLNLEQWNSIGAPDGDIICREGEDRTRKTMAAIIKTQTESYILDKATALGITVSASITVSEDPIQVPVAVELKGSATPFQRLQLESLVQEDIGITKENIQWTE